MSAVLDRPDSTPTQRSHRRSVNFVRWLRRIHLYVGLWGAVLGLLFGATGILLNHRAVMKIPVERAVQRQAQVKLPEGGFAKADDMAVWLQAELKLEAAPSRMKADPPRRITWNDQPVEQPERWTFNWQSPQRAVSAEYFVGNRFLKVETQDATPLGLLMRLHQAAGVSAFWVLLADTIAGGMMVLSITGLLMWTRLHTMRLATVVVACGALLASVWFLWTAGTGA